MTPDDIAAIRRGHLSYSGYPTPDIAELCDALEAAWIRADDLAQSLEGETRRVGRERERAERAEALHDAVVQTYETRMNRLLELLDEADGEPKRTFWPSEILAAIEGDSQ